MGRMIRDRTAGDKDTGPGWTGSPQHNFIIHIHF